MRPDENIFEKNKWAYPEENTGFYDGSLSLSLSHTHSLSNFFGREEK
jgi:hypothetical protein